jgi:RHS repeat-associated protein
MFRRLLRTRISRVLTVLLVAGQVLTEIPTIAATTTALAVEPPSSPPAAARQVSVNRTVPSVSPPPAEPQFSASPTVQEIFRARVFSEPLVPVGGQPTEGENLVLARTLLAYHRSGGARWEPLVADFLLAHRSSPWRASLLANVATAQLNAHAFSLALASWSEAWSLTKNDPDPNARAVADFAVAQWLTLAASFGQIEAVEARLAEIADRRIGGSAGVQIERAREATALTKRHPEKTIPCGPAALLALLSERHAPKPTFLTGYRATLAGTSLFELQSLADRAGLSLRMAVREGAVDFPVPAVVHLNVSHYVAVVERESGRYRVIDRGQSYWISSDTLQRESSGFALISTDQPSVGWRVPSVDEAGAVYGRGPLCADGSAPPPPPCAPGDPCCVPGGAGGGPSGGPSGPSGPGGSPGCSGAGCGKGMTVYQLQLVTASLTLFDTPAGYTPPRGPNLQLTVSYHQRDGLQPQTFTSSNMGPKWGFDWLRFVQEVPTDALGVTPPHVWVAQRAGGREVYVNPDAQGVFGAHWASRAVLIRVSSNPVRYERRLRDGTVEVYAISDGAPVGQRRVLLTELIDPLGQSVALTWDAQARLVAITDAVGQVTTIQYALLTDPLKITKITDPFGRFATFSYNKAGQLESITDVIGLTSSFAYGPNDFVNTLSTPYGKTSFRHEPNAANIANQRFVEATDALGATERVEFQWETPSLASTAPAADVPAGFTAWNTNLDHYNTFYWDKRAWMEGAGDLAKAIVTHWMVGAEWPGWQKYSYVPHSIKTPLTGRVWYAYSEQTAGQEDTLNGSILPSRVGRVLEDGSSQIEQATFNAQGSVLTTTDALGRQTIYVYGPNGVQLLQTRQATAAQSDLLAEYSNFNSLLQPQTITDQAGQIITVAYNPNGQPVTLTNARNETVTYTYDVDGYLEAMAGPTGAPIITYARDMLGRVRTVTDSDGYAVTTDYDDFDRPLITTFPDGTFEAITYDRLDAKSRRSRDGRLTYYYHDPLRRLTSVRDPQGGITAQHWSLSGELEEMRDPVGNRTRWVRDIEGRVIQALRADASATLYTYGNRSGRLETITDPKNQVLTLSYFADGQLASTVYSNATVATPTVSYTYDAYYGRLLTMTDGTGVTTYSYHQSEQLGAGQVASVDGPQANDTVTYSYDELSRQSSRSLSSATTEWTRDTLGRVTAELNPLGTFSFTYDGLTDRPLTVGYPNGQTSTFTYFDHEMDDRLQAIHHKFANGSTLSRFEYAYDSTGNVLTWRQQIGSEDVTWGYEYDANDRIQSARERSTSTLSVLSDHSYGYDAAGNRVSEQHGDEFLASSFDSMNRLVSQGGSGRLRVGGTVDEPATLNVQGVPATVSAGGEFKADIPVSNGTNVVTISAVDNSGNAAMRQYEVDSAATGSEPTSDQNGNVTAFGGRTFTWNAANEMIRVTDSTETVDITYDGMRRESRRIRRQGQTVLSDITLIWCGFELCEERDTNSGVVTRAYWSLSERIGETEVLLTYDHLGSVREAVDQTGQLRARYTYDTFGQQTKVVGDLDTTFGYAGLRPTGPGLAGAVFRWYDPTMGRWMSPDPIGLSGGANAYDYVGGAPVSAVDPSGLLAGSAARVLARLLLGTAGGTAAAVASALLLGYEIGTLIDQHIIAPKPQPRPKNSVPDGQPPKNNNAAVDDDPVTGQHPKDPVTYNPVNPGKDDCNRCKPCPPNGPQWSAPGNKHGATNGTHWHWFVWNQDPVTCICYPKRMSGPSAPW